MVPQYDASGNPVGGSLWFGEDQGGGCQSDGSGNLPNSPDCTPAVGFTVRGNVEPQGSFLGRVATDAANATPALAAPMSQVSITDWSHFENLYRGWVVAGSGGLFDSSNAGRCVAGSCQINDYTLAANDTVLKNQYGVWTNDGVCPAAADSGESVSAVTTDASGRTFLAHAIELMSQWLNPNGNFDGLCESDEVCLYTPNIGSYQGLGDPATVTPCTIVGGNGVTNVVLYAYPIN